MVRRPNGKAHEPTVLLPLRHPVLSIWGTAVINCSSDLAGCSRELKIVITTGRCWDLQSLTYM
jgi:hypothetical protein